MFSPRIFTGCMLRHASCFFGLQGVEVMKLKKTVCLVMALILGGCTSAPAASDAVTVLEKDQNAYLSSVNVDYGYNLAVSMEEIRDNAALGYRTAGSPAEFETGEMLKKEMEAIGLQNVTKDAFTLDGWTFDHARLAYEDENGETVTVELGGYQCDINTEGEKEVVIVDGGNGTYEELSQLDVKDRYVLIDINQRENWWINYPAYEAHLAGALGVIAAQDGGYGEVSDEALNAQDICGPADAPALSISRKDMDALRNVMAEKNVSEMTVTLDALSTVTEDVQSYNIVGTIPGKSDDMVLMSAHYDSYFAGFQDDNAAIALMMSIAKAIVDSGYQPQKTLVFCAMAAEEWGVTNTRYDWSTGAYNQIFRVHPEWVGKVIADINFELPAMDEGDTDQIRSSYELKTFLEEFAQTVPAVEGIFENGIEVIVPTQTWSDDFSLSIAGVPSTVTALRGGFAKTHYHSQFDNRDTYSKEAFTFHHNLYGMLMIAYDQLAVSPLDFETRLNALKEVSDNEVLSDDQKQILNEKIDAAITLAKKAYEKVTEANQAYAEALNAGDMEKADEVLKQYSDLNDQLLKAFKLCEDYFVRLTWEDSSQFPHEHSANNLIQLQGALDALENSEVSTALDEYLWAVDNNWYAYDFSKETFDYFTDYVLNQPSDRLMWGDGRVQGHNDLYDLIHSLYEKKDGDDVSAEISFLNDCIKNEYDLLQQQVDLECAGLDALSEMLKDIL